MKNPLLVLLHGWSVTDTATYGGLPSQLATMRDANGERYKLHDLRLGRYISFRDEVRMSDLVRAMESAVRTELADHLAAGRRLAVITHSTGGPLAREWWYRYYARHRSAAACPMSHLIMLAPANFGSALAQLGKGRISQLKSWMEGVQPGQGVLDWLELGSPESWTLNTRWIRGQFTQHADAPVYPFVITGQTIDRRFYDFVNSYTYENGSDGVVRVASANLNSALIQLRQHPGVATADDTSALEFASSRVYTAPRTAFRLLEGASHSGERLGIMRAVAPAPADPPPVVAAIRRALSVRTATDYATVCDEFEAESRAVYARERCEVETLALRPDRRHIHDAMSMLIFRVTDSDGREVTEFDLLLTGAGGDPNHLPEGFFQDRQQNKRARNTVTYFVNHEILFSGAPVVDATGAVWRQAIPSATEMGLIVDARPAQGYAHYTRAVFAARPQALLAAMRAHQTLLVDIVLQRIVRAGALQFGRGDDPPTRFVDQPVGSPIPFRDDSALDA